MITFTRWGIVSALLLFTWGPLALLVSFQLTGGPSPEVPSSALYVFAVLFSAVGIPVNWLVGVRMNTEQTPAGPRRHDTHTIQYMPMQYWGFLAYPLFSIIAVVIALGADWGAGGAIGAAVAGVVLVVGIVIAMRRSMRAG